MQRMRFIIKDKGEKVGKVIMEVWIGTVSSFSPKEEVSNTFSLQPIPITQP